MNNRNPNAVAPYTSRDVMIPDGFDENVDLIIQTYAKDLTPQEMSLFAADAHQRGLSIVKRQIYATKYNGKMTIMVGIDGYRSQAESHPDYAGQDGPYWCGEDGQWRDVWLSQNPPMAAKVGIYRKGFQAPVVGVALWAEYFNGSNPSWKKFPSIMLAKCAEAQAIRKAFPSKLGGTYISEEMDQANAIETTARPVTQAPPRVETSVTVEAIDTDTGEITESRNPEPQLSAREKAMRRLHAVARDARLTHEDLHRMAMDTNSVGLKEVPTPWLASTAHKIEQNPEQAQAYAARLALEDAAAATESDETGEDDVPDVDAAHNAVQGEIIDIPAEDEAAMRRRRVEAATK